MDRSLALLSILSLLAIQFTASESSASVFFIDSATHNYLRDPSSSQTGSISLPEVGAAVSVLLGVAPPSTLSAASSAKLNEVLEPNPFDRPQAVFMLEVAGAEGASIWTKMYFRSSISKGACKLVKVKLNPELHAGSELVINSDNSIFGGALKSKVSTIDRQADIQLPVEDVSLFSLNEDVDCSDKEISDFAYWLGGSYVTDALVPLNGELVIPMADGSNLRLQLTKNADRKFATSLVSLVRNIQKAMENHEDISQSVYTPSELIKGKFDGLKALQEIYGTEGVVQQGHKLFVTSVSKVFKSLQTAYKGQIVGVFICTEESVPDSKSMLNVALTSRPSSRWLEEKEVSPISTAVAKVELVRKSVAWITGIILLIATLLGVHFLLNMPLTRDTLLYSNVKLD